MTRIKVCGITSVEDALLAAEAGASFVGLNFYEPSPRYVSPEKAREIVTALPPEVTPVGIFVNLASPELVVEILSATGVEIAQLHGDEGVDYCGAVGFTRVIKAFRAGPEFDLEVALKHPAAAVLLDAWAKDLFGGTGKTVDWDLAAAIAARRQMFLAGGLGPGNIELAVTRVFPYAVDLNSGVETSPGVKSRSLLLETSELIAGIDADKNDQKKLD